MKIAFLSSLNPQDINKWSGTLYYIFQTLQKDHQVEWLGRDLSEQVRIYRDKSEAFSRGFCFEQFSEQFGKILSEQLDNKAFDLIVVFEKFFGAYLDTNIPVVFLGDTTFFMFKEYLSHFPESFLSLSEDLDRKMLNNCDLIIYSSEWAKSSAVKHYGIDPQRIAVVEFGANLSEIPTTIVHPNAKDQKCHLVFIGKKWEKKGGPKLYQAYRQLRDEGYACRLTLIGCTPVLAEKDPNVTVIPFLDKAESGDRQKLDAILKSAHWLVLPTTFDCYGIVFCEASAYGVPSLASDVGGVSQVIREGVNGFLLPADASADQYARLLKRVYDNTEEYLLLREKSRNEFESRLNWNVWRLKINNLFSKLIAEKTKHPRTKISDSFYISTYIINLPERIERRTHIQEQFKGKDEFDLIWVEACRNTPGTLGLWNSIRKAVSMAQKNEDDVMILCEDDHYFTEHYSKRKLMHHILDAHQQGVELLIGGIGGFGSAFPVAPSRYWVDWYWSNQFLIIYNHAYSKILDYQFKDTDTADGVLSQILCNKIAIHPFISRQKNFGYSDVTLINQKNPHYIENYFHVADKRLRQIQDAYNHFHPDFNFKI